MQIIISPAKKMNADSDGPFPLKKPGFLEKTAELYRLLQALDLNALKRLWACNDQLSKLNFQRLKDYNPENGQTPAILAYEGIQYRFMAPRVFTDHQLSYIADRLFIISGLYGMLRPFDAIVPYRLEMQAKLRGKGFDDLYQFWGSDLAAMLFKLKEPVINLASKEYSKAITPYLPAGAEFITCVFGELKDGRVVERGTQCKMARGEMVRFMAENNIGRPKDLTCFDRLNYVYSPEYSNDSTLTFIKGDEKNA